MTRPNKEQEWSMYDHGDSSWQVLEARVDGLQLML
jgi:hypothetical protein